MILDIPFFKCFVLKRFITDFEESGVIEAYCFAVSIIPNRPLLFTVHTIEGAVYSRIPIQALVTKNQYLENPTHYEQSELDPWGAIGHKADCIKHAYLKDYRVNCFNLKEHGRYHCTINYSEGGYAEDPEQFKTSNIIFLDNGQIAALPNNHLQFIDSHFTDNKIKTNYKRTSTYYAQT